jgi:cardiolipin synthase
VPATTSSEAQGLDRVITVPNAVTALRLASVPVFEWLLFGAHRQAAAAILLGVMGATDWVDGFLARRLHQVSTLGKVLDPTADRILVGAGVISVIVAGAVPLWFGVATIVREALVSLAVLVLAALGSERIDVLWVGKAGTFGLMFAYPTFLLAHGHAGWQSPIAVVGWVFAIPGLALAWLAAAAYVPPARRALGRGRRGRAHTDDDEQRDGEGGETRGHTRGDGGDEEVDTPTTRHGAEPATAGRADADPSDQASAAPVAGTGGAGTGRIAAG